uniref:Inward rectifier potassium channel C-terminal domain-containing protein n=1 Tax=Dunaliella tertiolecta TaxID=3047 RepID=A0A7S3QX31_DUNTE|mmetsp:Transcript_5533/g.14925  ORF Transcript_5533/g.14925 Transcript_5533/m.14925 type:complete len:567 (+) Transcript_5533:140-1840(+)|eukprot:CAMPEP_0202359406 /NCGR_PEP_ID=MMETSP1126-20121109/12720_1 /ASSEMBLY_ACC=CAM_ASM_000457 /TAXON_ID=3047 /ORGANISM="Dunaliella tertiolecta, Strain CCMP1320" /LENGTH=566 /DNA_ID=CAMNT_0048952829 /DNA_START=42 /DNA_END=1742 /DNA_ORIENTATION=+
MRSTTIPAAYGQEDQHDKLNDPEVFGNSSLADSHDMPRTAAEAAERATFKQRVHAGIQGPLKHLQKMKFPFRAPSLIDRSRPYFSGIKRFGISKMGTYYRDPFHTLLNLPWIRFIFCFFATYFIQYILFALIYWAQYTCIVNGEGRFARALLVSSRVASTMGFDDIFPDPNCGFLNFCIMCQVIFSSLVNFVLLGVVFARFSAPFKRASTVRFSKNAVVNRHPSGFWCISLRVANLRKHQILQPSIRMVVTVVDSITPSYYHHEMLTVEGGYKQVTNLELGFPAHVTHVITPDSYLYNTSLLEMDTRMMEVLVFVDGIDAMTSRHMSARTAYPSTDIILNQAFAPMHLEMRGKSLGLDFSTFDQTLPAIDPHLLIEREEGTPRGAEPSLWQLRHMTFKRLAERYAHLGAAHSAAAAAAAHAAAKNLNRGGGFGDGEDEEEVAGLKASHTAVNFPQSISTITRGSPYEVHKPGGGDPLNYQNPHAPPDDGGLGGLASLGQPLSSPPGTFVPLDNMQRSGTAGFGVGSRQDGYTVGGLPPGTNGMSTGLSGDFGIELPTSTNPSSRLH